MQSGERSFAGEDRARNADDPKQLEQFTVKAVPRWKPRAAPLSGGNHASFDEYFTIFSLLVLKTA